MFCNLLRASISSNVTQPSAAQAVETETLHRLSSHPATGTRSWLSEPFVWIYSYSAQGQCPQYQTPHPDCTNKICSHEMHCISACTAVCTHVPDFFPHHLLSKQRAFFKSSCYYKATEGLFCCTMRKIIQSSRLGQN